MDREILQEALQIDYQLRSTFFYRKLYELGFNGFLAEIEKLIEISDNFNWEGRHNWGISETAWNILEESKIPKIAVFAHPRVLLEQPKLSGYYRSVAVLPQKAAKKLAFSSIDSIEEGKGKLSQDRALILCQLYNSHSSLIIESTNEYSQTDMQALMYASAGAQINGSWLNKIGEEAELLTRRILIRLLLDAQYIVAAILKDGSSRLDSEYLQDLVDKVDLLSGVRLINQTSIIFSTEPDLSLLNPSGEIVAVIEVKGGKDTAGALERYGAAKKSFEEAKRFNPHVTTIFLASCITDEVNRRLQNDEIVNYVYNLTQIVTSEEARYHFASDVLRFIDINIDVDKKIQSNESTQNSKKKVKQLNLPLEFDRKSKSDLTILNFSHEKVCEESARISLESQYAELLEETDEFNRKLVSYQGNKGEVAHGWIRYKEGFSFKLVEQLIKKFGIRPDDTILDPFCGSGTTLLVCKALGINALGFEILPICHLMWEAKAQLENYNIEELTNIFEQLIKANPSRTEFKFPHITITKDAFPAQTENDLMFFSNWINTQQISKEAKVLYQLLITSILEEVSYTRKDGQYLRWDYRSQKVQTRNQSRLSKSKNPIKAFNKGNLPTVKEALLSAFKTVLFDISSLQDILPKKSQQDVIRGSVLELLPKYESDRFSGVITSPPYCNRYDYTRTYALELAYLGVDESEIRALRQNQLCCTVENRSKLNRLTQIYRDINKVDRFENICKIFNENSAFREVNNALATRQKRGEINNQGILSMVEGYFCELTFLFAEIFRTCKKGAYVAFVNDNVRYGGEIIPVDMICTEIAETIGFVPEKIYVLPQRKGNSSQQMGRFGKESLRKSITVWRKP
ncbi:XcyI family restriction endonuclease [Chlorogloeopsis sp. ULAP02]|uniref:XcyI family restriction endonuclease n=1 Tax=Chlorogloeopsis sp. ULAP02 TaxID=3107926 RepID=UPI0031367940